MRGVGADGRFLKQWSCQSGNAIEGLEIAAFLGTSDGSFSSPAPGPWHKCPRFRCLPRVIVAVQVSIRGQAGKCVPRPTCPWDL